MSSPHTRRPSGSPATTSRRSTHGPGRSAKGLFSLLACLLCATVLADETPDPTTALPLSTLPWTLQGVFAHASVDQAGAIVAVGDQAPKYVTVGDVIAEAVTLESVERASIVLRNDGAFERLYFVRARKRLQLPHDRMSTTALPTERDNVNREEHPARSDSFEEIQEKLRSAMEHYRQPQTPHDEQS